MDQRDTVLLFLMDGGALMSSEGTFKSFTRDTEPMKGVGFIPCIHPVNMQIFLINLAKIVSVQEVPRKSVHIGPNKIEVPGGRIN